MKTLSILRYLQLQSLLLLDMSTLFMNEKRRWYNEFVYNLQDCTRERLILANNNR